MMDKAQRYLPREGKSFGVAHLTIGLTIDPVVRALKKTILNPALTLPIYLLPFASNRAKLVSLIYAKQYRRLRTLVIFGLLRWINNALDWRVQNRTTDAYHWDREIVVVTGGSNGIGALLTQVLAAKQVNVVVLDILPLSYTPGPTVKYYQCDLSSLESIQSVSRTVVQEVGSPTVLVNNAGVALGKSVLDATHKDIALTFNVNVLAHYWLVKEFVPSMAAHNHGMVVNLASAAAFVTAHRMTDYGSAKAGVVALHEGLTTELRAKHSTSLVRTVLVTLGNVKTQLSLGIADDQHFVMPALEPQTVADAIADKIMSGTSGHILLPGAANLLTIVRALPQWMQVSMRADSAKIMATWRGRQIIDPNQNSATGGLLDT